MLAHYCEGGGGAGSGAGAEWFFFVDADAVVVDPAVDAPTLFRAACGAGAHLAITDEDWLAAAAGRPSDAEFGPPCRCHPIPSPAIPSLSACVCAPLRTRCC